MFINSGCPDFPVTMPHFLDALKTRSGIRPMLIFSDDHTNANTARQRAVSWGWHERMYILDQDECGCYMDTRQRHTVMLQKLAISAPDKYHLTVNLLVLMSKRGAVLDTSQYLDMAHL
ncbi:MAG: hypothetical protein JNM62_16735 [Flavobacteriales bacterium]|nr:hypothetical protein [Flavobacteriales bacterium]